jgi:hypothetical protein
MNEPQPSHHTARRPNPATHHEVLFTLRKDQWRAICEAVCRRPDPRTSTWELHLYIGAPDNEIISGSCGSRSAVIELADTWKGRMRAKGWD